MADAGGFTDWLGLLNRIVLAGAAGRPLSGGDAAVIAQAFARAIIDGRTLEASLLPRGWRTTWRIRQQRDAAAQLWRSGESRRAFARRVQRALIVYRPHFLADVTSSVLPSGQRLALFKILASTRGVVPSTTALRTLLPPARSGQRRPLSLASNALHANDQPSKSQESLRE